MPNNIVIKHDTGETIKYHGMVSGDCAGVHVLCNGFVNWRRVSEEWNVLKCRNCGLRVYFPATIDLQVYDRATLWEKLEAYFQWVKSNNYYR